MKWFSFRMRAISVLSFETGMSRRCRAWAAFRMRASMSAIGSVIMLDLSPIVSEPNVGLVGSVWHAATDARSLPRATSTGPTATSSPSEPPGSLPATPSLGSRCGRARTSAGTPGAARNACTDSGAAPRTSASASTSRSGPFSPFPIASRPAHSPHAASVTRTGCCPRNGIPISRSSAIASSSRRALVVITMSIPWIFSTLS